jgi:hypothetical protein
MVQLLWYRVRAEDLGRPGVRHLRDAIRPETVGRAPAARVRLQRPLRSSVAESAAACTWPATRGAAAGTRSGCIRLPGRTATRSAHAVLRCRWPAGAHPGRAVSLLRHLQHAPVENHQARRIVYAHSGRLKPAPQAGRH